MDRHIQMLILWSCAVLYLCTPPVECKAENVVPPFSRGAATSGDALVANVVAGCLQRTVRACYRSASARYAQCLQLAKWSRFLSHQLSPGHALSQRADAEVAFAFHELADFERAPHLADVRERRLCAQRVFLRENQSQRLRIRVSSETVAQGDTLRRACSALVGAGQTASSLDAVDVLSLFCSSGYLAEHTDTPVSGRVRRVLSRDCGIVLPISPDIALALGGFLRGGLERSRANACLCVAAIRQSPRARSFLAAGWSVDLATPRLQAGVGTLQDGVSREMTALIRAAAEDIAFGILARPGSSQQRDARSVSPKDTAYAVATLWRLQHRERVVQYVSSQCGKRGDVCHILHAGTSSLPAHCKFERLRLDRSVAGRAAITQALRASADAMLGPVLLLSLEAAGAGLGAQLHMVAAAVTVAVLAKRQLALAPSRSWTFGSLLDGLGSSGVCRGRDRAHTRDDSSMSHPWNCVFQFPISSAKDKGTLRSSSVNAGGRAREGHILGLDDVLHSTISVYRLDSGSLGALAVDDRVRSYAHGSDSVAWWRGSILLYLARLTPAWAQLLCAALRAAGLEVDRNQCTSWEWRCPTMSVTTAQGKAHTSSSLIWRDRPDCKVTVSLHLRRGDKFMTNPRTSVRDIVTAVGASVRVAASKLGKSVADVCLYVASDDVNAPHLLQTTARDIDSLNDEMKKLFAERILWDAEEPRQSGCVACRLERGDSLDGSEEALHFLKNAAIMASSAAVIVSFSSNLGRLVHELRCGACGVADPSGRLVAEALASTSSVDLLYYTNP